MAISNYTHCKKVELDGTWRYCKAGFHDNGKIKPDVVFVDAKQGLLEKHGRYYMNDNGTWIDAGSDCPSSENDSLSRVSSVEALEIF